MKFEDLLMQPSEETKLQKIKGLEDEVEKLRQDLEGQLQLKSALQCALQGPRVHSCPCVLSVLLPTKVQKLLTQVAKAEEEVICMEREVYGLKLRLYQNQKQTKELEVLYLKQVQPKLDKYQKRRSIPKPKSRTDSGQHRRHRIFRERRSSWGGSAGSSSNEISSLSFMGSYGRMVNE